MIGFASALRRKYDIAQQQADAMTMGAVSERDYKLMQMGLMPATAKSENRLRDAQSGLYGVQAEQLPLRTAAEINRDNAAANLGNTQARLAPAYQDAQIGVMGAQKDEIRAGIPTIDPMRRAQIRNLQANSFATTQQGNQTGAVTWGIQRGNRTMAENPLFKFGIGPSALEPQNDPQGMGLGFVARPKVIDGYRKPSLGLGFQF